MLNTLVQLPALIGLMPPHWETFGLASITATCFHLVVYVPLLLSSANEPNHWFQRPLARSAMTFLINLIIAGIILPQPTTTIGLVLLSLTNMWIAVIEHKWTSFLNRLRRANQRWRLGSVPKAGRPD